MVVSDVEPVLEKICDDSSVDAYATAKRLSDLAAKPIPAHVIPALLWQNAYVSSPVSSNLNLAHVSSTPSNPGTIRTQHNWSPIPAGGRFV